MTSAGLLDRLVSSAFPARAPAPPSKAAGGIGMAMYDRSAPLSSMDRSPQAMARLAQEAYVANRHIRRSERLISQRFSTVPWHLETGGESEVAPDHPVVQLLEKPYAPQPGDPVTATPRTRSDLWGLTCRHMGLCGLGFWYLDQTTALAGIPLQVLYVNPARMTAAANDAGQLLGWVLDDDGRGGGTPLDVDDVVPFYLEPPDAGWYGTGLVASALSMVELTRHADRHATGVLSAGGRLAGLVSPKGDSIMEREVYDQLVLDFRRVAENPDSARRINILRGPTEFVQTSATLRDLDLLGIERLTRDDISELWGVPRSQVGGESSAGLNSGQSKGYDEAVLWQNAVSPRLRTFAETLQARLLDRFALGGPAVTLVIEEPEFDDETPLFERAAKAIEQPLTNRERRELLGLDPLGDGRDDEVWMASTMARVYPEAEPPPQLAPFAGRPPTLPPGVPPRPALPPVPDLEVAKARLDVDAMRAAIAAVLQRHGARVAEQLTARADHLARKPSDVDALLSVARLEADLAAALAPFARSAIAAAGTPGKADLREPVLERLLAAAGIRVRGIAEHTRDRLREVVTAGIADGLSMAELGDRIESTGLFGELRAETIARTETATVLNQAALAQYQEFGVERVRVVDGDGDDACAAADGAVWTLAEAEAAPLGHPNCVRTFTPLVGGT